MKKIQFLGACLFTIAFMTLYYGMKIGNEFLFIFSLPFIFIGGIIVYYSNKILNQIECSKSKTRINDLKINGIRIEVDLTSCEIRTNQYVEQQVADEYKPGDYIFLPEPLNLKKKFTSNHITSTVLIANADVLGVPKKFISPIINREKTTLLWLLNIHQKTFVYVNRTNHSDYYFDLEFLND